MGEISDDHEDRRLEEGYTGYWYPCFNWHKKQPKPAAVVVEPPRCSTSIPSSFYLVFDGAKQVDRSWRDSMQDLADNLRDIDRKCLHRCMQPFKVNKAIQGVECEHGVKVIDGQRTIGRILKVSGCDTVRCACIRKEKS